jgi:hypothetical protein
MSREDVERNRDAQNPRTSQEHISNDEQRAGNLPNDRTAHNLHTMSVFEVRIRGGTFPTHLRHISNPMTPAMIIPKIALDHSRPCIQKSPSYDTESAAHSPKIVHGGRDRQDSDGKDDFQENDGCSWPFDCAEVDASRGLEDLVFLVRIEDATGSRAACARSIVFDIGLGVGRWAFFLV